jgi:hypothetical protein
MWVYRDTEDTRQLRKDELSSNKLKAFLRNVVKPSSLVSNSAVLPFLDANPPDSVSFLYACTVLSSFFRTIFRLFFLEFVFNSSFFFNIFLGTRHVSEQSSLSRELLRKG